MFYMVGSLCWLASENSEQTNNRQHCEQRILETRAGWYTLLPVGYVDEEQLRSISSTGIMTVIKANKKYQIAMEMCSFIGCEVGPA